MNIRVFNSSVLCNKCFDVMKCIHFSIALIGFFQKPTFKFKINYFGITFKEND